jgi:RNA polymerase sigma-70 factor (ECF subfamily)
LYDRFGPRLYRVALGLLGSPEDAEDAVQELFVGLVRWRGRLEEVDDLEGYLFVSLRHAVARRAAQRSRQAQAWDPARLGELAAGGPGAAPPADAERLARALGRLPPAQREVIALKIDGSLTFAQIGRILEISPNTAASRYRYALERLRTAMEERS